ncbi:energy transducer TonB family protein [Odoribacter laneus]|uniref:energy transducer TonB family protein n=1 Tax=Odoribacter laneus TaxID=626933 RepID=UPI0003387C69|nr:energy transducer TonB [Odoribacter laneus]MBS1444935.1 energy transducer TonB [Odoribacter sp.]CCZ80111.1 tonB family domain-containing protein [Odoribacter laneus CAG:561]
MKFKDYIKHNFYAHKTGIMGTVIFHLLLAIFLLSMGISQMKVPQNTEIELISPPEEEVKKILEEKQRQEEIRKKTSTEQVEQMLRSIAVNENIPKENNTSPVQEYIDEIRQELENEEYSGRYSKKRNEHYRQDSIRHQRDKKEQTLDSLKSTFYSGKSSVSYNLKNRYALFLPIPIFKCEFGGTVVVNIEVNRKGIVQRAEVVRNLSEQDDCLYEVAVDAALRSKFNPRPDAELLQVGTITFHFVKQ